MNDGRLTRSEQHCEEIERFLNSNAEVLPKKLYGREITSLQRKYPEIIITKGEKYRGSLYNCFITKKL